MRILQICQRPQRRGAEMFAHQLSAELRRQGHEVGIVYLYPHSGDGSLPVGPHDHLLDGDEDHLLETLIGFGPSLLRRLGRTIRSFRPDVTQLNGARTVKYGVLARWVLSAPTGAVVYRNIGVPQDWIQGPRRKLFYRAIMRNVDGVVAISRDSLVGLHSVFGGAIPLTVISNAVDPDALEPAIPRHELRTRADTPLSVPVVVFVGALSPEKRADRLIDAVGEVRGEGRDLHLWIVGAGSLRDELEGRVERLGLEPVVRFFGAREDVASYYAASDLLALTSDTEGIPAVLLEGGALGLPVVATRVGGVAECVEDGVTGLLVDPGDSTALVDALARLTDDEDLRNRMGAKARERVLSAHSIRSIAGEFVEFFDCILQSKDDRERPRPTSRARTRAAAPGGSVPGSVDPMESRFSPEMRFLLLMARKSLGPEVEERVGEFLTGDLDWELLLTLAERHKLAPLLAAHLRTRAGNPEGDGVALPPPVRQVLQNWEFSNGCRILEVTGQLVEVLHALREQGISAVPYKGPALAAQVYGSGALRPAGDLDLVVRPLDVPDARRILVQLGYRAQVPLDDSERAAFMVRHRYHERFDRADGAPVELHWRFSNRDFPFALDLGEAFSRLDTVSVGGHDLPAFRGDDLLLILSVHGAKHRWDRLEWIAAVAELVRSSPDLEWERLLKRAEELGVLRTLFVGLELARTLVGAPLPDRVARRIRSDRQTPSLIDEVIELLRRDPAGWDAPERLQRDRFRIRLRERWWDRVRFVWHRTMTPSDPERWDVIRVGGWLVPLHALRRPVHVVGQLAVALRALTPSSP